MQKLTYSSDLFYTRHFRCLVVNSSVTLKIYNNIGLYNVIVSVVQNYWLDKRSEKQQLMVNKVSTRLDLLPVIVT